MAKEIYGYVGSSGILSIRRSSTSANVGTIFVASPSLSLPELWGWYVGVVTVSSPSESHCGGEHNVAKGRHNPGEERP